MHELTPVRASLEEVFMELTSDTVEYRSRDHEPVLTPSAASTRSLNPMNPMNPTKGPRQ